MLALSDNPNDDGSDVGKNWSCPEDSGQYPGDPGLYFGGIRVVLVEKRDKNKNCGHSEI